MFRVVPRSRLSLDGFAAVRAYLKKKGLFANHFKQIRTFTQVDGFLNSSYDGEKQRFSEWTTSLPDKGGLSYLYDWLTQIGIGSDPIGWAELKAWSDLTGIVPTPDEATAVIQLSRAWSNEFIKGRSKDAFPPWLPE